MDTEPLSPFGVELVDVDLHMPLTAAEQVQLRELVTARRLVLARGQQLVGADQVAVMRVLGPVLDESTDGSYFTHVSNSHDDGRIGEGRLLYHSDLAFTPEPIRYLSLYATEVPEDGAPTLFADAVAASAALPDGLRSRLDGRSALHIFDLRYARGDRRFRVAELPDTAPRAAHPILMTHPDTGEVILYVNEMQTDNVVGADPTESEDLLAAAREVLYAPEHLYEHRWRVGDLAIWDNLALQHARGDIGAGGPRTLRRVPVGTLAVQLQN